jgi:hypothetical protein
MTNKNVKLLQTGPGAIDAEIEIGLTMPFSGSVASFG